ncbi:MAG: AmmeMemoRadiSam system protein B [Candidatus Aenigmarchaeota archaeon ex4484_56]|nr:MAG: AmmeMemoRadiSam system protein B [Candidatus Aenigmarchaeota archaeon ex4484_56]
MRTPICAGTFYPKNQNELLSELNLLFEKNPKFYFPDAKGIIVPHAGYLYSGYVAAQTYKAISEVKKRNFVILGVDHHAMRVIATSDEDWITPLGTAKINREYLNKITKEHAVIVDKIATDREHSIEVQLPFIQYLFDKFTFTPVQLPRISYQEIIELSNILKNNDSFFIASSDLTHYGSQYNFVPPESIYDPNDYVKKLDREIIEIISRLDSKTFFEYIENNESTVCGYIPIALLIEITKKIGAKKIELISYDTSFSISHDTSAIVGYAGIVII